MWPGKRSRIRVTMSSFSQLRNCPPLLGVRVIPEFDMPAHVGFGWQFPGSENFTVCVGREPWYKYCVEPPCGQVIIQIKNLKR